MSTRLNNWQIMRITSCISDKKILDLMNANLIIFETYRNTTTKKLFLLCFVMTETRLLNLQDSAQIIFTHIWLTGYEKKQKTIKSNLFWIRIDICSNLSKISWKLSDFHHIIGARNISLICSGMRIEMSVQKWFSPILKKDKPNPRP